MICDCGEKCFVYQKIVCPPNSGGERKIFEINKCQRLSNVRYANPKKKKCSFYSEIEATVVDLPKKNIIKPVLPEPRVNNHRDELMKNIKLYDSCIAKGLNFKNYAARIDYHLDALKYEFFDYSQETVKELIDRITMDPDKTRNAKESGRCSFVSHELLPTRVKKQVKRKHALIKKQKKKEDTIDTMPSMEFLDNLTSEETKAELAQLETEIVMCKIADDDDDDIEETELGDHIEEEEEEQVGTYEYKEDDVEDEKDDGDFSD